MIVAAGLTPAWQQILRFERLQVGEVNRAVEAAWCASGKVLNVGIAASRLGADCRTLSPAGGIAGEAMRRQCAELGVAVEWVSAAEPTRVCTTLLDVATGATTELVENAKPLSTAELQAFRDVYSQIARSATTAVWTGSLPAGAPKTFYRELLEFTPGRIVVDARGPELHALLDAPQKPFVVKPNREELFQTVGRPLTDDADLHCAMRQLNERGATWVVVSQGPQAVWASTHDALWRATPPRVERVVNPIGCGDCLAAGIAVGLDSGRDFQEALRLGIAAASDNLATLHPARIDRAAVERIAASVSLERVK